MFTPGMIFLIGISAFIGLFTILHLIYYTENKPCVFCSGTGCEICASGEHQ